MGESGFDFDYLGLGGPFRRLSVKRERELARLVRGGDREARDELVVRNVRLVFWMVRRRAWKYPGMDAADLVGEGLLGLIRAAELFDGRAGVRFSTYASYWIAQALGRASMAQGSLVQLPVNKHNKLTRLRHLEARVLARAGGIDRDELARAAGFKGGWGEAVEALRALAPVEEIDRPAGLSGSSGSRPDRFNDGNILPDELVDMTTPESVLEARQGRGTVGEWLVHLPERLAQVLRMRFGIGSADGAASTLEECAAQLRVSRERVRQLELDALQRLREMLGVEGVTGGAGFLGRRGQSPRVKIRRLKVAAPCHKRCAGKKGCTYVSAGKAGGRAKAANRQRRALVLARTRG